MSEQSLISVGIVLGAVYAVNNTVLIKQKQLLAK